MIEFIIWATNPLTGQERPISEKVFDEKENNKRVEVAKRNGWVNIHIQKINYDNNDINSLFIKSINK